MKIKKNLGKKLREKLSEKNESEKTDHFVDKGVLNKAQSKKKILDRKTFGKNSEPRVCHS